MKINIVISCVVAIALISALNFHGFNHKCSTHDVRAKDSVQNNQIKYALNYVAQDRKIHHDSIFEKMPSGKYPVSREYLYEFHGLKIPVDYDCGNFNLNGGNLAGHPYFSAVPSRWIPCYQLQFLITSGVQFYFPEYPVIDEEYFEAVQVYKSALEARGSWVAIELGARWGTWGFRGLSAAMRYNTHVSQFHLMFMEPAADACAAIANMQIINNMTEDNIHVKLFCENANGNAVLDWSLDFRMIDIFHIDIQGHELQLLNELGTFLEHKVKNLVIGIHSDAIFQTVSSRLNGTQWIIVEALPFGYESQAECIHVLRGDNHWENVKFISSEHCIQKAYHSSSFGPVYQWDGEIIAMNRKFL